MCIQKYLSTILKTLKHSETPIQQSRIRLSKAGGCKYVCIHQKCFTSIHWNAITHSLRVAGAPANAAAAFHSFVFQSYHPLPWPYLFDFFCICICIFICICICFCILHICTWDGVASQVCVLSLQPDVHVWLAPFSSHGHQFRIVLYLYLYCISGFVFVFVL